MLLFFSPYCCSEEHKRCWSVIGAGETPRTSVTSPSSDSHTLDQWREPLQNSNACFSSPNCRLSGSSAAVGLWTAGKIEAGEVIRSSCSSTDLTDEHQAWELLWQRMQSVIYLFFHSLARQVRWEMLTNCGAPQCMTRVWGWACRGQAQACADSVISQGVDTDYALFLLSLTHTHSLSLKHKAQNAHAYAVDRQKDVFIKWNYKTLL